MAATSLVGDAFRLAFAPMKPEAVLRLREGTAWRHLPTGEPARFQTLCDIAALDAYLAAGARTPPVTMADSRRAGSAAVPMAEYAREDGRIDPHRLFCRFDAGATLVVSQFHEAHPPLARFCRGLEHFFRHAVQANIYLTPPDAQGFNTHFDTHDVLVLQVRGEKRWRLHAAQPLALPTRNTPWDRTLHAPADQAEEVVLRPGAALYVPRGTLHDAAAHGAGEASLHITVGLLEPSWADLLHDAIDLLEAESPTLRASLPTWRLAGEEGMAGVAAGIAGRLAPLADPALLERVVLRFLDRLAADRPALLGRGLIAPAPAPGERLRLAETVIHHLATGPDGSAALRWAGGAEILSPAEQAWLRRLEDGASAEDLGQAALAFCRRLHAAGLLVREGA
ncbi:cupin domain-containing protein [Muricoccus vinaceus]|uniref:Cupin domain-containing protein n=1 Tax=Muricoccus vinaceus TaxID=424704 RepID=A0ABV6IMI6_9PROT